MRWLPIVAFALCMPACADARELRVVPPNIVDAIKAATSQGDLVSVTDTKFAGRVLKADTITFTSRSRLSMTGDYDWVAVVARRFLIAAPVESFEIRTWDGSLTAPPAKPKSLKPPRAVSGDSVPPNTNGQSGHYGQTGQRGENARASRNSPTVYILAKEVLRQDGTVLPTFADVTIDTRGPDGGDGQDGQDGGDGGDGSSGGSGIAAWNGCEAQAGSGGRGGDGGIGGGSGWGAIGGNSGHVVLGGSTVVIDLLSFAKIRQGGGRGGMDGSRGQNGAPGKGGPRGSHPGSCGGGEPGADGTRFGTPQYPNERTRWPNGKTGEVFYTPIDVTTLF
jgi:hypothetical protein